MANSKQIKKVIVEEVPVEAIISDDLNFNKGSEEGKSLLDKSFRKFGAGRSILLDKNNRNIAGNKSLESFKASGGKTVVIVEADRDTLVAVKRPDLDLYTKEGREMALADNQTQAVNYIPDDQIIRAVAQELDIDTGEWGMPSGENGISKELKEEELRPFVMTHVLLSFPPERLHELTPYLEAIQKIPGVEYEQGSNG